MKKKILIVIGSLVLGAVVLGLCFLFYRQRIEEGLFPFRGNHVQELDIDDEKVQNLYKIANPGDDATLLKELYDDGHLSNQYILAMGMMNYIRQNISLEDDAVKNKMLVVRLDASELKKYIYEVLGEIEYRDESFYVWNLEYGVCGFTYESALQEYQSLNGCGGNMFERFYRKIVSAREDNQYLYIDELSIYVYTYWGESPISKRFIYDNCHRENILDYKEYEEDKIERVNLENYLDSASFYTYQFEKQNGKYIFRGLTKQES